MARVVPVLEEARDRGFLGPDSVEAHIRHATALAARVRVPQRLLDLGTGAGVPGLILAAVWPGTAVTLLDASVRRTEFCERSSETLGFGSRVAVIRGRAEDLGHDAAIREEFDLVTARSFARPAVTAECGGAFVRIGGTLLVTEPPADVTDERWPADGLAQLGLGEAARTAVADVASVAIEKVAPLSSRFPRRTGIPAKRPLWA